MAASCRQASSRLARYVSSGGPALGQPTHSRRSLMLMAPTPGPPRVGGRVMTPQGAFRYVRMVRASSPDPSMVMPPSEPRPSQAVEHSRRRLMLMEHTPGPFGLVGRVMPTHLAFRRLRMVRSSSLDPSEILPSSGSRPSQAVVGHTTRSRPASSRPRHRQVPARAVAFARQLRTDSTNTGHTGIIKPDNL